MSNSEQLSLQLKGFENNIQTAWKELQKEEYLNDVTLACDRKQIRAHKVVISSMSPVFKNILKQNVHQNPIIYLRGVKFRDLQNVLNYIYQGEVNVASEDLESFLAVAEDLAIQGMSNVNEQANETNVQNCSENGKQPFKNQRIKLQQKLIKIEQHDIPLTLFEDEQKSYNDETPELSKSNNTIFEDNFKKANYNDENQELLKSQTQTIVSSNRRDYSCKKCNENFTERLSFLDHKISVHQDKRYPCQKCEFYATRMGVLKQHISSVHDNIYYSCDECGINYKKREGLNYHIDSIHKQISYVCEKCGYKASRKSDLKIHIRSIHEGIFYPCEKCDFKAIEEGQLKRHVDSIHDGVRYPCNYCDIKFKQRGSLKTHIESIHEGIRYPCDTCGYKATEKSGLRKHIQRMHGNVH